MIVWSRDDYIFPAQGADPYRRDLPDAEFHLIDSGHSLLRDRAREVFPLIHDFLDCKVAGRKGSVVGAGMTENPSVRDLLVDADGFGRLGRRVAVDLPRVEDGAYTPRMRLHRTISASVAIAAFLAAAVVGRPPARAGGVMTERMDAHMETTVRGVSAAGDRARADAIVAAARKLMVQYPTVAAAEAAGFTKFLPRVPLPIEHYTNRAYAIEAWIGTFDAMHPTSLIFKRSGQQLTLVGVMYTAARDANAAELDRRVPLSVATWHRHVAFCAAPAGSPGSAYFGSSAKFGLLGSIATQDACTAAGGTFRPVIFGWMVHVWPNETDPAKIWAVDPDGSMSHGPTMDHGATMSGMSMGR